MLGKSAAAEVQFERQRAQKNTNRRDFVVRPVEWQKIAIKTR
jgi:hypothetical protein